MSSGQIARRGDEQNQAVAVAKRAADSLARYSADIAMVLPDGLKPETFVRLATGLVRRDPKLAAAAVENPASFFAEILECARLGHEPGTDRYALTAFRSKVRDERGRPTDEYQWEVTGIEQYQGVMARMLNAGTIPHVDLVYSNDEFYPTGQGRMPVHRYNPLHGPSERGELVAVYAWGELPDGRTSQVVVMPKEEVMKHKAVARTDKFWIAWEEDMWRKTALHKLEKYVPTATTPAYWTTTAHRAVAPMQLARQAPAPAPERPVSPAPAEPPVDGEVVDDWPDVAPIPNNPEETP